MCYISTYEKTLCSATAGGAFATYGTLNNEAVKDADKKNTSGHLSA